MQAIRSINISLSRNQSIKVPPEEVWKVTDLEKYNPSWEFSIDISPGVSDRDKKHGSGSISAKFSPNTLFNTLLGGGTTITAGRNSTARITGVAFKL